MFDLHVILVSRELICVLRASDVVTEFIEGLVETYPGLQYLDGFPEVSNYTSLILFQVVELFLHALFLTNRHLYM